MGRKGNATCSIEGCTKKQNARGWCSLHYTRWQRFGDPEATVRHRGPNGTNSVCTVDGCESLAHARTYCPVHYQRWRILGDASLEYPEREPFTKTLDDLRREAAEGTPGGTISPKGYRYRNLLKSSYAEHRLVMEYHLNRPLWPDETVHHKNGNRSDNRLENLELWSSWQPPGQRVEDKVAYARELLARYCPTE
jgi:hypothetical protein